MTKEEHMENAGQNDKPKIRLVKGGRDKPRSGVISGKDKHGKAYYRCSCDRCDQMATVPFQPKEGREILCRDCCKVMPRAKPSTRAVRKGTKPIYFTECDECLTVCKSSFLPKSNRPFLCNDCKEDRQYEEDEARREKLEALQLEEVEEVGEAPLVEAALASDEGACEVDEPVEPAVKPVFEVACHQCDKTLMLRFQPKPGERFTCPSCYQAAQDRKTATMAAAEKEEGSSGTRIFFNIECAKCGKKETVDFVPKLRSEAVCTSCFKSRKRR